MNQTASKPSFSARLFGENTVLRLLVIAILIFIVFSILLPGKFLSVANLQSMSVQFPEFGILAIAMMLAMITGGIDLSVVGTANLSSILAALVLTRLGEGAGMSLAVVLPLAILVSFVVGSLCGLFNGFLISRVGIVPMLATLGTMSLYTGLSYVITGGPAIPTQQLAWIGNGSILGVPIIVIIFLVIAGIFALILNRTSYGFNAYMYGTNATAARFSGISNTRVLMRTYWLTGVLAAVAGLVFVARVNSAKADYGESFVLLSVLICVLGGVSVNGGFGGVGGLVLAVLSLQFLSTGLNMYLLEVFGSSGSTFFRQFAWGALLLLVMVMNYYVEQRRQKTVPT